MKGMNRSKKCIKKEYLLVSVLFLCLSVLLVLRASNSTSPLYPTAPIYEIEKADQATFAIMGKHWIRDGKLPYADLFDHKGPLIFLINGLGWMLTDSVHGIAIIQMLFLFSYCIIAYVALRRVHAPVFSCFATAVSLVMLRNVYGGGNTVEEYGLPFQMLAFIGLYRWANLKQAHHDPNWAFCYGIAIASFILNRATDALCICAGCLVIFFWLLKEREYRNILSNALAGIAGIFVALMPFIVYFAVHGELEALWYGTIGYNIEYASGNTSFWMSRMGIKEIVEVLIYCVPIWGSVAVGILALLMKRTKKAALFLTLSTAALYFLFSSRFYDHYVITYVPLVVIAACELRLDELQMRSKALKICTLLITTALVLSSLALELRIEWNTRNDHKWAYTRSEKSYDMLMRAIPEADLKDTVLYNCVASIYLKYDFCPAYTYFALQDWQGSQSEKLMGMIEEEFAACEAKWVMTHGGTSKNVLSVLEARYQPVMMNDGYVLYCRNE